MYGKIKDKKYEMWYWIEWRESKIVGKAKKKRKLQSINRKIDDDENLAFTGKWFNGFAVFSCIIILDDALGCIYTSGLKYTNNGKQFMFTWRKYLLKRGFIRLYINVSCDLSIILSTFPVQTMSTIQVFWPLRYQNLFYLDWKPFHRDV